MLVPQVSSYTSGLRNTPFPVAQLVANASRNAQPAASGSTSHTSFRAPAHKHAHHLHSIPPREKSTRTLIVDHMLWVHGRTRFAQARAELGMTDRTGGPSSPNYAHRRRPENYEEEGDENSEGEDVAKLKSRTGNPDNPPGDDEEDRMHSQDLPLARSLRLRAEGLEKVVTSMLGQPPTIHPMNEDDIWTPPTSPKMNQSNTSASHPHTLPNGVRLRLALGTIINDLFARQAPPPPYRHQFQHSKSPSEHSPPPLSFTSLPQALTALSTVCSAHSGHLPSPLYSMSQPFSSNYHGHSSESTSIPHQSMPSLRTRLLYNEGADPSTANSPPSFRCPRHLHTGCEICVEAKTAARPATGSRGRSGSLNVDYRGQSNAWKGMPGGVGPGGGGITGWQDGSGIGSGLLRPGVHGSSLRRKTDAEGGPSTSAGNTKLSELIPRFIKLSALVAVELAMEARDEEDDVSSVGSKESATDQYLGAKGDWSQIQPQQNEGGEFSTLPATISPSAVHAVPLTQEKTQDQALRPTREWYMLLAGLLTRAVLEGYLTAGWRGTLPMECLLTVGLGMDEDTSKTEAETGFEEFDPDGLPTLLEAVKLLFPGSKSYPTPRKSQLEEEYEAEMRERLRSFYDIPASTPDLSTHVEDLAWQYPAEPVERAAVRFCEAIAKWRGKPELETYKKPPLTTTYSDAQGTPGSSTLTLESLVHLNPPTPTMHHLSTSGRPRRVRRKPSISVYFSQMPPFRENIFTNKRMRSADTRTTPVKRVHV